MRFFYITSFLLCSIAVFNLQAAQQKTISLSEPPGQFYDIGGYKLHLHCTGEGSPTVLLESGLGGFSLDWYWVQEQLSRRTQVCSYDRAGYGWSQTGPSPRTVSQISDELELLLEKAQINNPLVLVGHSFGGYNIQYFSKLHPRKTLGLVLVESSHPQQADRLPDIPSVRKRSERMEDVMVFFDPTSVKKYPIELQDIVYGMLSTRKTLYTQRREFLNFTYSGVQVEEVGELPDRPLTVITRGKRVWPEDPYGDNLERTWMELQKEFLQSSHYAKQVIARNSGHLVHMDEPDLVVATIMETLSQICDSQQPEINAFKASLSYCDI